MTPALLPQSRDLVLIGGGHTHALVLRKWAMSPLPGTRVTLINPDPCAPYTGMLPGFVAGHYTRGELDIDLVRLAQFAKARLIIGSVTHIDIAARTLRISGRPEVHFDVASIDIGITSTMADLPGFAEHAIAVKPMAPFAARWEAFLNGNGPARPVVIGAGVAGVEMALAMAFALQQRGRDAKLTILDSGDALSALRPSSAAKLRAHLQTAKIELIEQCLITQITDSHVHLRDGRAIPSNFTLGAAGARPYNWLRSTGLALSDGFVTVSQTLQSSDPDIFAVGDCAAMTFAPRPKAGVFAVRQAPFLFHNLQTRLAEKGRLRRFKPQKDYLKLISLGGKTALAERFGTAPSGPLMWQWKDRIDRAFMRKFSTYPAMQPPALPAKHASGLGDALGDKPQCGGCGSKIGSVALFSVIGQDAEDAAILPHGDRLQVVSTDHLRSFWDDPVVMTRIAAIHAMGDVWAMGAQPQFVLSQIILPRQSEALAQRALAEIHGAAHALMSELGAKIVGGHTSTGSEFTIGFTVGGLVQTPITLQGAMPGDDLVLTKPLGTGVVMAGLMQDAAYGAEVETALQSMQLSQASAARLLSSAHAMTDVTGFGLAGHLLNICHASGTGARIDMAHVPLLPGAARLSRLGVRSSLFAQNRAILPFLPTSENSDLLFDPQTAGGLLAAIADGAQVVQSLRQAGYEAAVIGQLTAQPGQIELA